MIPGLADRGLRFAVCMTAEERTSCDIGPDVLVQLYEGIDRPP